MQHLRSARHRRLIDAMVEARKAAGMSQREAAAKLKRSPAYVSKFEAAERRHEVCEWVELCELYRADAAEIARKLEGR